MKFTEGKIDQFLVHNLLGFSLVRVRVRGALLTPGEKPASRFSTPPGALPAVAASLPEGRRPEAGFAVGL